MSYKLKFYLIVYYTLHTHTHKTLFFLIKSSTFLSPKKCVTPQFYFILWNILILKIILVYFKIIF